MVQYTRALDESNIIVYTLWNTRKMILTDSARLSATALEKIHELIDWLSIDHYHLSCARRNDFLYEKSLTKRFSSCTGTSKFKHPIQRLVPAIISGKVCLNLFYCDYLKTRLVYSCNASPLVRHCRLLYLFK